MDSEQIQPDEQLSMLHTAVCTWGTHPFPTRPWGLYCLSMSCILHHAQVTTCPKGLPAPNKPGLLSLALGLPHHHHRCCSLHGTRAWAAWVGRNPNPPCSICSQRRTGMNGRVSAVEWLPGGGMDDMIYTNALLQAEKACLFFSKGRAQSPACPSSVLTCLLLLWVCWPALRHEGKVSPFLIPCSLERRRWLTHYKRGFEPA